MNRIAARLAALAMIALSAPLVGQQARAPNVILILTDDQGYGDVGVHGNAVLETPTMDRLALEGVRLTDFHVDPHCAPTRAALMTGRYSTKTGVWHTVGGRALLARDEVTMAEVFAGNGYRTAIVGKWHLGDSYPFRPQDRGFQEVLIHGGGGVSQTPDYWGNDYFDDHYLDNGEWTPFEGYVTDVFFNRAIDFVAANRERPFFLYLATNVPHQPWIVGSEYSRPYIEKGLDEELAAFYGMLTNLDENLDRLTRRLEELGLAQNTILIFMGDNGSAAMGYNAGLRGRKASPYEGGHRVPFFIRYPAGGLTGGGTVNALTAHIDVLPTLIALAGLEAPAGLNPDGQNLVPLLRGETWPERTLFVHSQRLDRPQKWRQNSVLTERWRLVNGEELYDIEADRGQQDDVAAQHPEVVSRLRHEYEGWWQELEPAFDQDPRFVLGSDRANPTRLTAHDWYPREGERVPFNQAIVADSTYYPNGFWAVEVAQAGIYEIILRSRPYPVEQPLAIESARLVIGGFDETRTIEPGMTEVRFTTRLEAGETTVRSWLTERDGKARGAYFIYIERLGAGRSIDGAAATVRNRPNVLFIMSDDHAAHAIGAYRSRLSALDPTPTLDRLAREGMRFDRAFVANSICTPSRATLLTGQHSHVNGVRILNDPLPPAQQYLPRLAGAAGYQTAVIGKWHLEAEPAAFEHYAVMPRQGSYFNPVLHVKDAGTWPDNLVRFGEDYIAQHESDVITDLSLEWLANRDRSRPFFLMHQFKAPHDNFENAERYDFLYEDVYVPEPSSLWHQPGHGSVATRGTGTSVGKRNPRRNMGQHMFVDPQLDSMSYKRIAYQRYLKKYLRTARGLDDNIDRLLRYLEETGELDNTVVIYTSDQGMMLGEHDYIDKRWMYEESMRMPLIVRYPTLVAPGSSSDALVNNTDFAPTLLDLMGVSAPDYMQGRSFVPILRGETPSDWREVTYYRYWMNMVHHDVPAHYGIRTKDYKLIFFYALPLDVAVARPRATQPGWELYDLRHDPEELRNVYDDPRYQDVVARLKRELLAEKERLGDLDEIYPELMEIRKQYWNGSTAVLQPAAS